MAITNSVKDQLIGIGTAGTIGTATASPTVDNTANTTTTTALTNSISRGKVRVKLSAVDSSVKIASIAAMVQTASAAASEYIGGFNPASADQTTGQGANFVWEFVSDLAIVQAAIKVTPAGSKSGTQEFTIDVELAGN